MTVTGVTVSDRSWARVLRCDRSNRISPGVGHGRNSMYETHSMGHHCYGYLPLMVNPLCSPLELKGCHYAAEYQERDTNAIAQFKA